jgi:hypothetical protein
MIGRNSLLLLALTLTASPALIADPVVCSKSTILGSYGFTLQGPTFLTNGGTVLLDGIALQVFDGNGNVRQVDAVADDGFLMPGWRPRGGSYSINPDCTGTEILVVPGIGDLHLQIIVAPDGNTIHQAVIDGGIATMADGERIKASQ